ncbi:MAG: DJ-1/PfpI family protein [Endomicrobiaceae bacterium]|nr:DJ-1/PfpI family protein [Endomicrobiaceae bacterium]
MKKIVFVVAPQNFRDEEYIEPKEILETAGFQVITASTVVGEIYGKIKIRATSDILVKDINPNDYDAIFFIGGPGASIYFNDGFVHNLVKLFLNANKIVSAICIAPTILANAGILKGKNATVFRDGADNLIKGGANYTANSVEIDGNILTGDGPQSAKEFGETLVKLLS